jgi:hypothetical protein
MSGLRRVLLMAEMHGRDLTRRYVALMLLIAMPLAFYLSSLGDVRAPATGGVGMAFAISSASLFSVLSSQEVDQRLVLGGYRPVELLLGRLGFLGPLGLGIAAFFGILMTVLSDPARPWVLALGLAVTALQAVPFGLAVGAAVPRELEGTLAVIGVIGTELATNARANIAKVLPFYAPRRLIEASLVPHAAIAGPIGQTLVYAIGLLVVARIVIARRIVVHRPQPIATPPGGER